MYKKGDDSSFNPTVPSFTSNPLNTVSTFTGNIFAFFFSLISAIWGFCASLIGLGPDRPQSQNNENNNQRQSGSNFESNSVQK